MAGITGSTTIDWSGVAVPAFDGTGNVTAGLHRVGQLLIELDNGSFSVASTSATQGVVNMTNGGTLTLNGSGFLGFNLLSRVIITSAHYLNAGTGQEIEVTGRFDSTPAQNITSISFREGAGTPIYRTTFTSLAINSSTGAYSGTLQRVEIEFPSGYTIEMTSPNYALSGNAGTQISNSSATAIRFTTIRIASPDDLSSITLTGRTFNTAQADAFGDFLQANGFDGIFSAAFAADHLGGHDSLVYNNTLGGVLHAGASNDTLQGSAVAVDTLIGGHGNDRYVMDGSADVIQETADQGNDTVTSAVGSIVLSAGAHVENVILTGSLSLNATGNELANTLVGNSAANTLAGGAGNDTLTGAAGADRLEGGADDDLYLLATLTDLQQDSIVELVGEGFDTVRLAFNVGAATTYVAPANVEALVAAGTGLFHLTGNDLDNALTGNTFNNSLVGGLGVDTLVGNAGIDTLDGGDGIDSLVGGAGNDVYRASDSAEIVVEALAGAAGGTDTVHASANFVLGANVEHLTLVEGSPATDGEGNTLANTITGNSLDNLLEGMGANDALVGNGGNDTLDGGLGNDTMTGGAGDDLYLVGVAGDRVVETGGGIDTIESAVTLSLAALAQVEHLTLTGAALNATGNALDNALTGTAGNNVLAGAAGDDTLTGDAGNDTLDGGLDNDEMAGGLGDDTYTVDAIGDVVTEAGGEGFDTVRIAYAAAVVDLADFANVEAFVFVGGGAASLIGDAADNALTGNGLNNTLTGNDGVDTLDGGAGNDTMLGGAGDDTYVLSAAGDDIDEEANTDANDTVRVAYAGSIDLDTRFGGAVEHATLTVAGTATLHLAGNEAANRLEGHGGANSLSGGLDADTLIGNGGNDTLDGGAGIDSMVGGAGNDLYRVDDASDVVSEVTAGAAGGTDTVHSVIDLSLDLVANVEHLTLVEGSLADNGEGNALANTLTGNARDNLLEGLAANDALVGNAGNDTLDGGLGNDTMTGGAGDDLYIVDAAGDRVVETLGGTDTIESSVTYSLAALAQVEHLTLTGGADVNATGNALANTLTGNGGNNLLSGGTGDVGDSLVGNGGNDTLDGGLGNDTMEGGLGDDTFVFSAFTDVATEGVGEGTDTIRLVFTVAAGTAVNLADALYTNIESVVASGSGFSSITGTGVGNALTGNTAANLLTGLGGDDTLDGGAGADTMDGGADNDTYVLSASNDLVVDSGGSDTVRVGYATSVNLNILFGGPVIEHATLLTGGTLSLTGTTANNRLEGGAGNNSILGASGADTLIGNAGNDTLDGGTGIDSMVGGAGNDVYRVDDPLDVVSEVSAGAAGGIDRVESAVTFSLAALANVEHLTLTGALDVNATGNALANALIGNTGNNTLDGGAGNDTMTGGAGNDTYVVNAAGDRIIELANGGTDTVQSSVTFSLAALAQVEHLTLTGGVLHINATGNTLDNTLTGNTGNNSLSGGSGNDSLVGNDGNDTLDGGAGNDTMAGGLGDDTFVLSVAVGDVMSDTGGTDTVRLGFAYVSPITLGAGNYANIENAVAVGTGLFNITGSGVANALTGNGYNNTLSGAAGNDTLVGGAGNDSLVGGDGNDSLDGGVGNDTMVGGLNDDTYVLSAATDVVTEFGGGGTDTLRIAYAGSINMTTTVQFANIEHATLVVAGTAALSLTGNGLNNRLEGHGGNNSLSGGTGADTLIGNAGNDTLEGGTGIDVMEGGTGNDVYRVSEAGETITELLNGGADRVESAITFSLAALGNVEHLTLTGVGTNINATGNALNNALVGNSGNNSLDGGLGNDTMTGGAGNDTYVVDAIGDVVIETGGGTDTIQSSVTRSLATLTQVEHLTLTGGADINATGNTLANTLTGNTGHNLLSGGTGNDSLVGNNGNDTLDGGTGVDTMVGGAGDDTYVLDVAGDVVTEAFGAGSDTIRLLYTPPGGTTINLVTSYGGNVENVTILNLTANNAAKFASLTGNGSDNFIVTGGEILAIDTAGGNDTIDMGLLNNQSITGGSGDDRFIFSAAYRSGASSANYNVKLIQDFTPGADTLVLDRSFFLGSALPGALPASAFVSGDGVATAQYAADRVIYNSSTGDLYYDPDGTGAQTAVRFAVLDPGLALTAADFEIIA